MKNFIIGLFLTVLLTSVAHADVSDEYVVCKAAVASGNVSWYEPSFVAKAPKVGKNEEIRTLEAPMCVHMNVVGGWKVVPVKAGTRLVFPKNGNQPVRHTKCNNSIKSGQYIGNLPGSAETIVDGGVQQVPNASSSSVQVDTSRNSFREIKLGEVMCVVYLQGGQYTNGQPSAVTFKPSKAACDEWELGVRARFMEGSVNKAVVTYDSDNGGAVTNTTPGIGSMVASATTTSSSNWCVRSGKRYDCHENLAVVRANGNVACRPQSALAEPGETMCSGIQ